MEVLVENLLRRSPRSERMEEGGEMAEDVLAQVLTWYEQGDYFQVLGLRWPKADTQGGPLWRTSESEVAAAYRRRSLQVHPDKHADHNERAKRAFEAVNEAYSVLTSSQKREPVLRQFAEKWLHWMKQYYPEELENHSSALEKQASARFSSDVKQQMHERLQRQMQRRAYYEKRKREVERECTLVSDNAPPSSTRAADDAGKTGESGEEHMSKRRRCATSAPTAGPAAMSNRTRPRRKPGFI